MLSAVPGASGIVPRAQCRVRRALPDAAFRVPHLARSTQHRTEHHALGTQPGQLFSTHVSLLPPPCDELTTNDPFRNATRVNPPGTMVTFSPNST